MKKTKPIKSAKQAIHEHNNLESVWSRESELSQRILIYMAELLEKLVKELRPKSAYNIFCAEVIRRGGTIESAAKLWQMAKGIKDDSNPAS